MRQNGHPDSRDLDQRARARSVAIVLAAWALTIAFAAQPGAETAAPAPAAENPPAAANVAGGADKGAAATTSEARYIPLTPEQQKLLAAAEYVYISSQRKDGSLSKPAEIWFYADEDSVWVGSSPKSWRVKRIRWGRPDAHIAIGERGGPSFWARGELVTDAAAGEKLCDHFAKKYASSWSRWEDSFRNGFKTGDRALIRYRAIQR